MIFLFYPYKKDIRVFVGSLSQFEEKKSLIVYTKNDKSEGYTLNGTVLFGKLSRSSGFRSLSKKDIPDEEYQIGNRRTEHQSMNGQSITGQMGKTTI